MKNTQPIGIFDSGIGGLTVAKAIEELLPNEQLIYVGDTQHMPYGDKSPEHIRQYCKQIVSFLLSKNVKLIVIACNTASSVASSYLRSIFWEQVEIMGVIRPIIISIIEKKYKKIGIIGTQGTINSNIYENLFREYGSEVKGMTSVGWGRARQLATGRPIGLDTVSRMAQFNRHRKNATVAPEYKGTPWKDAGHVAWLGWGGTTGVDWAIRTMEAQKNK
jgi:hypothetical protein